MRAFRLARRVCLVSVLLALAGATRAQTVFSDNFDSGSSPAWGNESGAWVAVGGVYRATMPNNAPAADSALPYNLTDFSVDFDVNDVCDGGVWLRSSPAPGTRLGRKGIEFNLQTVNGSKVYWHIVTDGNAWDEALNLVYVSYGRNPHVHIEVSGNTYSAYLNGSSAPVTTLPTGLFLSGQVAVYDYSRQSFDNFVLRNLVAGAATAKAAPSEVSTPPTTAPQQPAMAAPNPSVTGNSAQVVTPERPALKLESGLVICWPAGFTGYMLEATSQLPATNWARMTNAVNAVNQVVVPKPSSNRFYRLVTP